MSTFAVSHAIAEQQRARKAADRVLDQHLAELGRSVQALREDRDRMWSTLAYEGTGIDRLAEVARQTGRPIQAVFDQVARIWRVTYALDHVGSGLTLDDAARGAYDLALAAGRGA